MPHARQPAPRWPLWLVITPAAMAILLVAANIFYAVVIWGARP